MRKSLLMSLKINDCMRESEELSYSEIKDFYYFKNLLKLYDVMTLRDILPLIIEKNSDSAIDHLSLIHI